MPELQFWKYILVGIFCVTGLKHIPKTLAKSDTCMGRKFLKERRFGSQYPLKCAKVFSISQKNAGVRCKLTSGFLKQRNVAIKLSASIVEILISYSTSYFIWSIFNQTVKIYFKMVYLIDHELLPGPKYWFHKVDSTRNLIYCVFICFLKKFENEWYNDFRHVSSYSFILGNLWVVCPEPSTDPSGKDFFQFILVRAHGWKSVRNKTLNLCARTHILERSHTFRVTKVWSIQWSQGQHVHFHIEF